MELKIIARIYNDFSHKFGIPRQSGILPEMLSTIVFEPDYRTDDALRGIEEFSHLWLIWQFSENGSAKWSATVRPPRLGGNTRMGVFATRSPYRPNPIGLSSVRLVEVKRTEKDGTVLTVAGADILSGTPIYDIKPYVAYSDSHPDASSGFADERLSYSLTVNIPEALEKKLPADKRATVITMLENDPRPSYHEDGRIYGMTFGGYEIKFFVECNVLTVTEISGIL